MKYLIGLLAIIVSAGLVTWLVDNYIAVIGPLFLIAIIAVPIWGIIKLLKENI